MFTCPDCGMEFMDEPDFRDHIKNYDYPLNIDIDKCCLVHNSLNFFYKTGKFSIPSTIQ